MSKFTDRIDMRFQYVPAAATNVAKTIARERRRLAAQAARVEAEAVAIKQEAVSKVRRIAK